MSRIVRSWLNWLAATAVLLGALLVFAPVAHAQDKSLVWERFDVDIEVKTDGAFNVAEHQTIRFTAGEFTFGYREIPVHNYSYIDNWEVTDSQGHTYTESNFGNAPYTFTVSSSGDSYVVRWYFPSTGYTTETYTLGYTVHDGLRYYEGGDQLWWKAIYGDRAFPVEDGRVRVIVPSGARVQEYAAYINGADARDSATAEVRADNQAVVFDLTRPLDAGEEFEVRVEFTPGVVAGSAQPWQRAADEAAAQEEAARAFRDRWAPLAGLGLGLLGLLLGVGGLAGLYAFWYRIGRDKPVEMVADYLPEPPSDLPPGLAGTLLDERVDMEDILATVVDLARRKAISITEEEIQGFFRTGRDFVYRREQDIELFPYEKELVKALFGSKDEVRLSDLKQKFYSKLDGIKSKIYAASVEQGLFPASPEKVRNRYGCLGSVGIAAAAVIGFVFFMVFNDWTAAACMPGVGMGVLAVGVLVLARSMPRKTDKGAEEAAKWSAFRNYLENIEKYTDIEAQKTIWDRWLPYAIAFGLDQDYIRKFQQVDAPAPGWYIPSPTMYGPYRQWYYGTPGAGGSSGGGPSLPSGGSPGGTLSDMSRGMGSGLSRMSTGLGAMLTAASSTFSSRPASSSSGGGWSSGGGGFSGGGFSGGGGGGGGGGGFG